MKKIINGKMYNTETAKQMGDYEYSYSRDHRWFSETLYRKKTGEFFIFGKGNGASKYASSVYGGGSTYGEEITPLTYDEAREWGEENLEVDKYIEVFGEVEE